MNNGRAGSWAGHAGLAALFLGGLWLTLAPVWVGFESHRLASRIDEWAGAAVMVIAVATFFLQWAFGLGALTRRQTTPDAPPEA